MVDGWRRDHQASERGVDLPSAVTRLCHECDVAVAGGSMGGVATALAAADAGCKVVLTSGTDCRGGQMTSQGVSALDEHRYIGVFRETSGYYRPRDAIRARYQARWADAARSEDGCRLNPGERVGQRALL